MLMVVPVTVGLLCGRAARGFARIGPTWRERMLWLSSRDANQILLLSGAAVVMMLSLFLTMSRGGISALLLAIAIAGAVLVRRQHGARQGALAAYFAILLVLAAGWTGVDAIAARFSKSDWDEMNGRRGAWSDARAIARRFLVFGSGLDTYGVATTLYQRYDLSRHYNEAHNDYLQLAAEGGLLLVVPSAVAVVCLIVVIRRRFAEETSVTTYWLRVGAVTGLVAIGLQETVDFSLQMPGNAALFAAVCGIAIHRTPPRRR
jgi:O-antigen ligase